MGVKNFKSLFISIPNYIELSSELILVLGPHPGLRPNIYFFFCEMSDYKLLFMNYLFNYFQVVSTIK